MLSKTKIKDLKEVKEPSDKIKTICNSYNMDWKVLDWSSLMQHRKDYSSDKVFVDEVIMPEIKKNADITTNEIQTLEIEQLKPIDIKQIEQEKEVKDLKEHKKETEKQYQEILKDIKTTSTPNIDRITWKISEFVNMTLSDKTQRHTLIIKGKAGVGKTHTITKILKKKFDNKIKDIIKGGHITPLDYYNTLYDNPKGIFYWDDLTGVYRSETGISLMKQTTESGKQRYVRYSSTTAKLEHRNKDFVFEGKQIFALNNYPKGMDFLPILSRARVIQFNPTYKEIIIMMYELIKDKWKEIPMKEKISVVEIIERNTNEATKTFDLRLLMDCFDLYIYCGGINDRFNKLINELIEVDVDKELVLSLEDENILVKEQEKKFMEKTKMSRATFYNYRKQLLLK